MQGFTPKAGPSSVKSEIKCPHGAALGLEAAILKLGWLVGQTGTTAPSLKPLIIQLSEVISQFKEQASLSHQKAVTLNLECHLKLSLPSSFSNRHDHYF